MARARIIRGNFVVKAPDNRDIISLIDGVLTLDSSITLGLGAVSTGELAALDNAIANVTFVVAAGAANVCIITGTIKNAAGAAIAGVRELDVYISEAATGIGVTADTYSTGAAVTTGTLVAAITANKVFRIVTHTDGTFAISITASAKPADQYLVAVNPITRALHVSAASALLWGA